MMRSMLSVRSLRRLSMPALLGALLFGGSVLVVSAQPAVPITHGPPAVAQQVSGEGEGPPWLREDFTCSPKPGSNGRGGPSWLCGHGGVLLDGAAAASHPGRGPGRLQDGANAASHPGRGLGRLKHGGASALESGGHPGGGQPNWMRPGFACNVTEDGGRGGPPWRCGDIELSASGEGGPKGPAWLRSAHPGRGVGANGAP